MILLTSRIELRDLAESDAAALNAIERDPRVTRYTAFDPRTPEQTRKYLDDDLRSRQAAPRLVFDLAVVPLSSRGSGEPPGAMIGRCGLAIRRPEHREAELWYLLHPDHQGRGYATEAVQLILGLAFGELGLHRVYADCDPRNTSACRVATRAGLAMEGTLRENYRLKGEWCSSNIFSILDREWMELRSGPAPRESGR